MSSSACKVPVSALHVHEVHAGVNSALSLRALFSMRARCRLPAAGSLPRIRIGCPSDELCEPNALQTSFACRAFGEYFLTFNLRSEPRPRQRGGVNEDILLAAFRCNEAQAPFRIVKLNGA